MPKFEFNRRTGHMEIAKVTRLTSGELFQKVKRSLGPLIRRNDITDEYINNVIVKVNSGTRNINFLEADTPAKREIAFMILREFN